jgi:hypothetical protein
MAKPVWVTPAGSLGTIPQGVFYKVPLVAYEPEHNETVFYEVISGDLPTGIAVDSKGVMAGIPNISTNQFNTESQFAVRAYTRRLINGKPILGKLADRTFTVTVTGQQPPEFITPSGLVAQFYDGTKVAEPGLQIEFTDYVNSTIKLIGGYLPPALTINDKGLITGYVDPVRLDIISYSFTLEVSNPSGSNVRTFSINLFDRYKLTADNTYVTADNTFITADVTTVTPPIMLTPPGSIGTVPGNTFFAFQFTGADFGNQGLLPIPYGSKPYDLGLFDQGETTDTLAFAFWNPNYSVFNPQQLGNGGVEYIDTVPPGLTLDPLSGWLSGYLDRVEQSFVTYTFQVYAYEVENPSNRSSPEWYSLTIEGDLSSQVIWITPNYLGCINNGGTSDFYVKAVRLGIGTLGYGSIYDLVGYDDETYDTLPLQYQLKPGSYSLLPQGLQLLPNGEISGRASFDTFALDSGTTVFDIQPNLDPTLGNCGPCDCAECGNECEGCVACNACPGIECTETTFDMVFPFVVNVFSPDGEVNIDRECTILLKRKYNQPYENLYIQAMPPISDRVNLQNLLTDKSIFPVDSIYRPEDPFFGVAKDVVYWHAYGLTSSTRERYLESMEFNHYWKNLVLGEIKTARALDSNGKVLYEVVYSQVVDNLVNNQGVTVGKVVTLPYPIPLQDFDRRADTVVVTADTNFVTADCAPYADPLNAVLDDTIVVYPNGLKDMRDQIVDTIGQVSTMLPKWMLSPQEDGNVLGFTPAWVLAYTKPNQSKKIAYNIETQIQTPLNTVDFRADRYELDRTLSINWNPITHKWIPTPPTDTTFDAEGFNLPLNYIGTVDYATDLAFVDINYNTISYINSLGGIDGPIGSTLNQKTIIFAKQSGYVNPPQAKIPGPLTEDQAWTRYIVPYGSNGYSITPYSAKVIVPGEREHRLDPLIPNQRLAIWKMVLLPGDVVKLELFQEIETYDTVTIINGKKYRNSTLYVPSSAGSDSRYISWSNLPTFTNTPTVFDHNSMQFITPVDLYCPTDVYDQYLMFPKRNIITNV